MTSLGSLRELLIVMAYLLAPHPAAYASTFTVT